MNTEVDTTQFSGLAKYMQLTVYVDPTARSSLKEINFHGECISIAHAFIVGNYITTPFFPFPLTLTPSVLLAWPGLH